MKLCGDNNISFTMAGRSCGDGGGRNGEPESSINGNVTNGGSYVEYNIFGNLFQLPQKYSPPIRAIACGDSGIVCAAVDSETGEGVAIKKASYASSYVPDAERLLREIKLLHHMDHENVIALKDIICSPQREDCNDIYMVYELMDTDLRQIINSDQPLTDDHCKFFIYQLLRGLKYVHSANVLHHDLRPRNLLVNADCELKIGGFDLARMMCEVEFKTEDKYIDNTIYYQAPELLLMCSSYTAAIDIWSVGCILGEILTRIRKPLFPGGDLVRQLTLITELIGSPDESSLNFLVNDVARSFMKDKFPRHPGSQFSVRFPNASPLAIDLLGRMLVFDPNRRITVNEALSHPYFAQVHDVNEEPVCLQPFSFGFVWETLTLESIKELIWMEATKFNP